MKVSEAIARSLVTEGVQSVFGLLGDCNMNWLSCFVHQTDHKSRYYAARHEAAALAMADGYARASGGVGVCTVTCGPGLTQLTTSLMVAKAHGTPLVVLVGDTPAVGKRFGAIQDADQLKLAEAAGAFFHPIRSPVTAAIDVQYAFYVARTLNTPVVLNAPLDLQDAEFTGDISYHPWRSLPTPIQRLHPDPAAIEAALSLITRSKRPIIIAGNGAVKSGARPSIERLAGLCGALVATTLPSKGYLHGSAWNLGVAGGFGSPLWRELFMQADCVVAVGASLNPMTTMSGELFPNANIVRISLPEATLVPLPGSHACHVFGDATTVVDELCQRLDQIGYSSPGFRDSRVAELLALDPRLAELEAFPAVKEPGRLDPREAMLDLDARLTQPSTIVVGLAHFAGFPMMFLRGEQGRDFIHAIDFGAIGQALPTAIGAAIARPDRLTVVIEGDTSVLMHIQEIDTAVRYGLWMLLIVMDDDFMGAEFHILNSRGLDAELASIPTPDLAALAKAFGCSGLRATDRAEFNDGLRWLDDGKGLHVIDLKVSHTIISPAFRRLLGNL